MDFLLLLYVVEGGLFTHIIVLNHLGDLYFQTLAVVLLDKWIHLCLTKRRGVFLSTNMYIFLDSQESDWNNIYIL